MTVKVASKNDKPAVAKKEPKPKKDPNSKTKKQLKEEKDAAEKSE